MELVVELKVELVEVYVVRLVVLLAVVVLVVDVTVVEMLVDDVVVVVTSADSWTSEKHVKTLNVFSWFLPGFINKALIKVKNMCTARSSDRCAGSGGC